MKKAIKIIAITLAVLILAMIITPFFFKDKIAEVVKKEINSSLNAKVDFGTIGLNLFSNFPNFTFSMNDLSVVGIKEFKKDTLINVKSLALTIDLRSVISGNYEITKILFDKPNMNLLVLKNNKCNWDIVKEDTTATKAANPDDAPFKMKLKSVEFKNANIVYDDKAGNMYSFVDNLNMNFSGDMSGSNSDLKLKSTIEQLTYKMDNISYLSKVKVAFDAEIASNLDSMKFTFKDNSLSLNGLTINFAGFVAMPKDDIAMDLKISTPKADFKSVMSLIPAFYTKDFDKIQTKGKVALNGKVKGVYGERSMPAFDINIDISNAWLKYPDLPKAIENIQIATRIKSPTSDMNDMVIDVSKFHFEIAKNPMDIRMLLKTPLTDPDIDANFKGKMNLATISEVYPLEQDMKMSGLFNADVAVKGKQSSLDKGRYQDFKSSGNMNISKLTYKDKDYPNGIEIASANMNFTPQNIDLTSFNATYAKNTISANGKILNYISYLFGNGTVKANFNLTADYLNINKLLEDNNQTTTPATSTTTPEAPMTAFDVPANIDFTLQCIVGRITYDNLDIKSAFGKLVMANKQVGIDNLNMELLGGKMEMNGYYNSSKIDSPLVHLILGMKNFDIKQTYNYFDMVKKLAPIMQYTEGNFSCLMSYEGKLDKNMNPDLNTVNAKGAISTSPLTIQGAKSIEALATALKVNELKKLSTDPMDLDFVITDGKLLVKPFATNVNGMPFTAQGTTYLNQNIDYDLTIKVPREKLGSAANAAINSAVSQANAIGGNVKMSDQIDVKAKLKGTTTKPTVDLNFKQSKDDAKAAVKEEVTKVKEDLTNQAKAEADKIKAEMQQKAQLEIEKQKKILEDKQKEAEARAKQKAADEAKKLLNGWK